MKTLMTLVAVAAMLALAACEQTATPTMQANAGQPPVEQKADAAPQDGVQTARLAVMAPATQPVEQKAEAPSADPPENKPRNASAEETKVASVGEQVELNSTPELHAVTYRAKWKSDKGNLYPWSATVEGTTVTFNHAGNSRTVTGHWEGDTLVVPLPDYKVDGVHWDNAVVTIVNPSQDGTFVSARMTADLPFNYHLDQPAVTG